MTQKQHRRSATNYYRRLAGRTQNIPQWTWERVIASAALYHYIVNAEATRPER